MGLRQKQSRLLRVAAAACILIYVVVSSANALSSPMGASRRESRYFDIEVELPPLARNVHFANSTAAIPYSAHAVPLPVMYTNNPKVVSQWLSDRMPSSSGTLGFDVESVPVVPWMKDKATFQGPATVQLATPDACLVVHLTRRNGRSSRACAPILEAVLADDSIVKAGAGIDQDMLELYQSWMGLEARSRFDLGGIGSFKGTVGLQRLTKDILGLDLEKSKRLALSNWSQVPLTPEQLAYCARDAWAGAAIVAELAARDPDTFGTPALVDLLQSQRSVKDLHSRARKRKQAKMELNAILAPYVPPGRRIRHEPKDLPPSIQDQVTKLKQVMTETSCDHRMVFDVAPLGFTIESK